MTTFQDYSKHVKGIDRQVWLGRLCWYSVGGGAGDVKISHKDLLQALVSCDLGYTPRIPNDVDAFRRACSAAQRKRVSTVDPSVYENYLIRDLPTSDERAHKVLVRETVATNNLTYHTELCKIDFVKSNSTIEITCIAGDVTANQIADDIRTRYVGERGMINSYGVRELIRKILTDIRATNVKGEGGGGIYFVSEHYGAVIDKLERFATMMPGTVLVHSLPLLDDSKQRDMLRRAFESESVEEINRLVNEIAELDHSGKTVTSAKVAAYFEQLSEMRTKAREYSDLLELGLDSTASAIEIFQNQVLQLSTKVVE